MFKKYKKIKVFSVLIFAIILGILFLPKLVNKIEWNMAVEASGSMPYQIGLTNVTVTQCYLSCYVLAKATCCMGGTLCTTKEPLETSCPLYSDVTGSMSGGMGSNALFSNINIGIAGLASGGQLIAGGMSMSLMDSGVLASKGGCAGCTAKATGIDKYIEIAKYVIAGFRK